MQVDISAMPCWMLELLQRVAKPIDPTVSIKRTRGKVFLEWGEC